MYIHMHIIGPSSYIVLHYYFYRTTLLFWSLYQNSSGRNCTQCTTLHRLDTHTKAYWVQPRSWCRGVFSWGSCNPSNVNDLSVSVSSVPSRRLIFSVLQGCRLGCCAGQARSCTCAQNCTWSSPHRGLHHKINISLTCVSKLNMKYFSSVQCIQTQFNTQ